VKTWKTILRSARSVLACAATIVAALSCPVSSHRQAAASEDFVSLSPRGLQVPVHAGEPDSRTWQKPSLALGVTLGIVIAGMLLARKFMPGVAGRTGGPVRVLCQAPLGARGVVYVLRCGPRVLVVGATAGQLTTLSEISDPDEIDQFTNWDVETRAASQWRRSQQATRSSSGELKGQLHGMLDKIETWNTQT
jgi:flagellar biogenesis protein FliO